MNNNEILVRKAIEDKEREANSYEDQGCYNAAYCYGYAAGASDALSSLKQPDQKGLSYARSRQSRCRQTLQRGQGEPSREPCRRLHPR